MASQAMSDWEDVLNAYVEGRSLRADAEDLLMRLHIDARDREQIERSLRLSDEVTSAMRGIVPPVGMEARLVSQLRACAEPAMPQGWEARTGGFGRSAGAPTAEEELLDAAVEGRMSADEIAALRGRVGEAGREELDELDVLGEMVVTISGPEATPAADRLRDALRAHVQSEAGEIDQRVVNRLLTKKTPKSRSEIVTPDVLAAEERPGSSEDEGSEK